MRPTPKLCQKVLCISEDAVKACLEMKPCLAVNRQAFIDLAQQKAVVPTRIGLPYQDTNHHTHEGETGAPDFTLFKPAAIPERDLMAMKLVSIRRHNPAHGFPLVPATVISVDPPTGMVNGIVAGTYLTGARTATGSAWSILLYKPDLERLVIIGAGLQARLHIEAIATILGRAIPHVTIVNRTLSRAQELVMQVMENTAWAKEMDAVPLAGTDPLGLVEALSQADVVVTATNTTTPLFPDSIPLKPGCHICSVGSYTPQMQEIAARIVDQCTVIMDTLDARSVGDLKHLTYDHPTFLLGNILVDQGEITDEEKIGKKFLPPRDARMPYTFFKSVGTAIQDVYTTNLVMEEARARNLGNEIEL